MLQARSITFLDVGAMIIGLFLLSSLVTAEPNYKLVAGNTLILVDDSYASEGKAKKSFKEWRSELKHFGAFAVAADGAYGWSRGHNALRSAEDTALALCEKHGEPCSIVARMQSDHVAAANEIVVSLRTASHFRNLHKYSGSRAFSYADAGQSGWSWNYKLPWSAETRSKRQCSMRVEKANAADTCRVVARYWFFE